MSIEKNTNPNSIVQDNKGYPIQNNLTPVDYANLDRFELSLNEENCPVLLEIFFNDGTKSRYKEFIPHKGTTNIVSTFIENAWKVRD